VLGAGLSSRSRGWCVPVIISVLLFLIIVIAVIVIVIIMRLKAHACYEDVVNQQAAA
jgi:type IV secretory pathway component VirB8